MKFVKMFRDINQWLYDRQRDIGQWIAGRQKIPKRTVSISNVRNLLAYLQSSQKPVFVHFKHDGFFFKGVKYPGINEDIQVDKVLTILDYINKEEAECQEYAGAKDRTYCFKLKPSKVEIYLNLSLSDPNINIDKLSKLAFGQ